MENKVSDGFFSLGHCCQSNERPLRGFVLVARVTAKIESRGSCNLNSNYIPPLLNPVDYSLMWCSEDGNDDSFNGCGYFWLSQPP